MAKLMAPVPLVAWLIVALAVNECSATLGFRKSEKQTDSVPEPKTDADWVKESHACYLEMKVSKNCGDTSWVRSAIRGVPRQYECRQNWFQYSLVELKSLEHGYTCNKFVNEYMELYLKKCGLERRFKQLVDKFEQALQRQLRSDTDRTLYGYLESQPKWDKSAVNTLFYAIKRTDVTFDGASGDIECTGANHKHLRMLRRDIGKYEDLHALVDDYYKLFLDRCYEARFQQACGNLEQLAHRGWDSVTYPTLNSYQVVKDFNPDELIETLSLIYEIFKPNSTPTVSNCTEENEASLIKSYVDNKSNQYRGQLVADYVALYFNKCGLEDDFRKVLDFTDPDSTFLELSAVSTFHSWFVKNAGTSVDEARQPILVVRKLAELVNSMKETDCTDELGDSLVRLLGMTEEHQDVRQLLHVNLANYLTKCGFEERLRKAIDSMAQFRRKTNRKPDEYEKLISHFKANSNKKTWILRHVLPSMKVLFKFEGFSKETHCNMELIGELLERLRVQFYLRNFKSLLTDHFAFYLDECGLEQSFKRTFAIEESPKMPSLFQYLSLNDADRTEEWRDAAIAIIGQLSKPDPDCSQELVKNFSTILELHDRCNHTKFSLAIGKYLKTYESKCGAQTANASV